MYRYFFKRLFDFILSLLAIIILSPVMIIIAILVKVKLGSPIIFIQERPGKNEKIFKMFKFRSMTDQRDENGNLLSDDIRLTKFGKLLRSTSLDELPELFNILKGDMSIVGPRPLMSRYLSYYTQEERIRHNVRPGLTGYAQINGRNSLSWDEKLKMDVVYVRQLSLYMDLKIILNTVLVVVKREGIGLEDIGNLDDYRNKKTRKKRN